MTVKYIGYKKGTHDREHREILKNSGVEIPKANIVHHKDGDGRNNSVDNLQIMTRGEHQRLHFNIQSHEPMAFEYVPEECPKCNKIHMVQYRCTKRPNFTGLCKSCNGKLNGVNR